MEEIELWNQIGGTNWYMYIDSDTEYSSMYVLSFDYDWNDKPLFSMGYYGTEWSSRGEPVDIEFLEDNSISLHIYAPEYESDAGWYEPEVDGYIMISSADNYENSLNFTNKQVDKVLFYKLTEEQANDLTYYGIYPPQH